MPLVIVELSSGRLHGHYSPRREARSHDGTPARIGSASTGISLQNELLYGPLRPFVRNVDGIRSRL